MDDLGRVAMERYLAGDLSREETDEFLDGVRRSPEALAELGRTLELQAELFDALRTSASKPETERSPRVRRRRRAAPSSSPLPLLAAGGVAAGFILVVILALSSAPPRPARKPSPPVAVAPQAPPPVPPTPSPSPRPRLSPPRGPRVGETRDLQPPARPLPSRPPERRPIVAPSPSPVPPAPKPPAPAPRKTTETRATVARLVDGSADLDGTLAPPETPIPAGAELRTIDAAIVRLPDGTEVRLGAGCRVTTESATLFSLREGAIQVKAVKQRPGRSLEFHTPHAKARVIGTRFRLAVEGGRTRLDVSEGKVRLTRTSDGAAVTVAADQQAFAGPQDKPRVRPRPIEQIVLRPGDGKIEGRDWTRVRDEDASTGMALEAPRIHREMHRDFRAAGKVTFTFRADEDREYRVWVRGKTLATETLIEHDAVVVGAPDAIFRDTPGPNVDIDGGPERGLVNGYMHRKGYWWVGGDADANLDLKKGVLTVRFLEPGLQTLYLYTYESPVRIDTIWLSATQTTRPDPKELPPLR